jgi:uncharacterized membrane protein
MSDRTEHRPNKRTLSTVDPRVDPREHSELMELPSPEVIGRTVTIDRPRSELYAYCRDLSNFPTFMDGVESVDVSADGGSARWTLSGAEDKESAWDTAVIVDEPAQAIGWRTTEGSRIEHEGRLEFKDAPGGRGTLVSATVAYRQVGGAIGGLLARVFHKDPRIQTQRDLRRFKQLMETGEIATAQPPDAAPRG